MAFDLSTEPVKPKTNIELLAIWLHTKNCRLAHEDVCGWYYEKSWDGSYSSHRRYLTQAQEVIDLINDPHAIDKAMNMARQKEELERQQADLERQLLNVRRKLGYHKL